MGLVLVSALGCGGARHADSVAPSTAGSAPQGSCVAASPFGLPPGEDDTQKARAHAAFQRGISCYRTGEYLLAAQHFELANQATIHAATTFNLALAYDAAGRTSRAIECYDLFLRLAHPSDDQYEFAYHRSRSLRAGLPGSCTIGEKVGGLKCPPPQPW